MSADVAYVDTSALVKLVLAEAETAALRAELGHWPRRAASAIITVELLRTVARSGVPALLATARQLLADVHVIRVDQELLDRAAALEPRRMRSLDAIHLSSALALGEQLGVLVTYDRRMVEAAAAIGLRVSSPA